LSLLAHEPSQAVLSVLLHPALRCPQRQLGISRNSGKGHSMFEVGTQLRETGEGQCPGGGRKLR
jgi:hypothetical protein